MLLLRRLWHRRQTQKLIIELQKIFGMKDEPSLPNMQFSLILGAGFSSEAGYPLADGLSQLVSQVNANDIEIDSSGYAWYHQGHPTPNFNMSVVDRKFIQLFLEFYLRYKLDGVLARFNYEKFYDYYHNLMFHYYNDGNQSTIDSDFENFYNDFIRDHPAETRDKLNIISHFHSSYIQLIFSHLYRVVDGVHRDYIPRYNRFASLMSALGERFTIHLHTLNHDLLLDQMKHTNTFAFKMCDGFEELGSPYYAEINGQKIRTQFYNEKYDKLFRVYKLHGSVDYLPYICQKEKNKIEMIKMVHGAGFTKYFKEIYLNCKYEYDNCWINYVTNFLSGEDEKQKHYPDAYFYKRLFEHFKTNLKNSKHLITIGFGFSDKGIEKIIEEYFLKRDGTKLIAISPGNVPTHGFFTDYRSKVEHYNVGVANIDVDEIFHRFGIS